MRWANLVATILLKCKEIFCPLDCAGCPGCIKEINWDFLSAREHPSCTLILLWDSQAYIIQIYHPLLERSNAHSLIAGFYQLLSNDRLGLSQFAARCHIILILKKCSTPFYLLHMFFKSQEGKFSEVTYYICHCHDCQWWSRPTFHFIYNAFIDSGSILSNNKHLYQQFKHWCFLETPAFEFRKENFILSPVTK